MNAGEQEGSTVPETSQVPYSTDGTDFRGALRHYYAIALKRFAKFGPIFALMWVQIFVWKIEYLLPLAIVGFIGFVFTLLLFCVRASMIWRCSRVFRIYPLELRGPVEKVRLERPSKLFLRLGKQDQNGDLDTMLAKDPLGRPGWPGGIVDGVWFAGDEPFGGAAIVRGTGELLFMQPDKWELASEKRKNAGAERINKARRAGIKRPVKFR